MNKYLNSFILKVFNNLTLDKLIIVNKMYNLGILF